MRKMATVRTIKEIKPIANADAIELAVVDGWQVVVKKGEFSVNSVVLYLEVDSWVPTTLAPFLSRGNEPKVFNEVQGERLRTVKLRGCLSQGLILPVSMLPEGFVYAVGDDVSEVLGVQKWEMPVPAKLAGEVKGNFPSFIAKTDQERIQNLSEMLSELRAETWEVTEKLHGSSMTCFIDTNGEFHVCSRNLDLKETESNAYWKAARKFDIENKLRKALEIESEEGKVLAVQGELIGQGINGNQYQVDLDFYVFDVLLGDESGTTKQVPLCSHLFCIAHDLKYVPVLDNAYKMSPIESVEDLLTLAEGKSKLNGSEREGLVFKSESGTKSFKVVSNKWLLKTGE